MAQGIKLNNGCHCALTNQMMCGICSTSSVNKVATFFRLDSRRAHTNRHPTRRSERKQPLSTTIVYTYANHVIFIVNCGLC